MKPSGPRRKSVQQVAAPAERLAPARLSGTKQPGGGGSSSPSVRITAMWQATSVLPGRPCSQSVGTVSIAVSAKGSAATASGPREAGWRKKVQPSNSVWRS